MRTDQSLTMALCWLLAVALSAQLPRIQGVPGSDFVLAFVGSPQNVTEQPYVTVTSSDENDTLEITSPLPNDEPRQEQTMAGDSTTVFFDAEFRLTTSGKSRATLRVQAQGGTNVTLHGSGGQGPGADLFLGVPVSSLGTDHLVVTADPASGLSQAVVVATANDTNVTMAFLWAGKTMTLNNVFMEGVDSISFTLDAYEAFVVSSPDDLSATAVTSDLPVAVFSGNVLTGAGQNHVLVEQLPPVRTWGRDHVTIPTPGKISQLHDEYRIVTSVDNTTVITYDGNVRLIRYAGRMRLLKLKASQLHLITADKPIQVVKVLLEDEEAGMAPCLSLVVPLQQWRHRYAFSVPANGSLLSLVVQGTHNTTLLLNDSPLDVNQWAPVPNSSLVGGELPLEEGVYLLTSSQPNVTFAAHITGFTMNGTFCHPLDMNLFQTNMNFSHFRPGIRPSCDESTPPKATTAPNTTSEVPQDTSQMTSEATSPAPPEVTEACLGVPARNLTSKELNTLVAEIVANLTVNKRTLSANVRRKTSAPDPRPSSTSIGAVGIVLIAIVPVLVLVFDFPKLFRDCKFAKKNIRKFRERRQRSSNQIADDFPY